MRASAAVLGVILGLAAGALLGAPPAKSMDPLIRPALQAARTVRLEVQQDYDLSRHAEMNEEEKTEDDKAEEGKPAGQKPEEEKPAKARPEEEAKPEEKYSLPLSELAEQALKLAGWTVVKPDETADVTMTIEAHGTPQGGSYVGSLSGYRYTGAELKGSVRLVHGEKVVAEKEISAEIPVAQSISTTSYGYASSPRDAPFAQTLPDFCEALFVVIGRARGPEPVVAGLKQEDENLQIGAGRALFDVGDATVEPALIELLGRGHDQLGRIGALGLGVYGSARAWSELLAVLRKDTSETTPGKYHDESDNELLNSLTREPDEPLPAADRATAALRQLNENLPLHRAVEWALVQIAAPDKFEQLTTALQSPDSVMLRRSAAVVLGSQKDPRAFGPLAAATRDKEPMVRAAAVAALGRLSDERKTDILLAASADGTDYVSKLARGQLGEPAQERWTKFMQAQLPPGIRGDQIPGPVLREGFAHADPLVRAGAARAALYRTEPGLQAGLAALLQTDRSALVREAVAESLAEARDDRNSPLLALALGDADAATRRHAVKGLTQFLGNDEEEPDKKAARRRLPATILGPVCSLQAANELSLADAAELLARVEGPGAEDSMLRMLAEERPPAAVELIAHELARRGDKRAGLLLLARLAKATDGSTDRFLADALVTLADPQLLDPLIGQLKQGPLPARQLAANVLGRLGQPRAIGPLIATLRAADNGRAGNLFDEAHQALQALTGKTFETGDQWLAWWKENAGKPFTPPPPPPAET